MTRHHIFVPVLLFALLFVSCNNGTSTDQPGEKAYSLAFDSTEKEVTLEEFSYAMGASAGHFARARKLNLDKKQFIKGYSEARDSTSNQTEAEIQHTIQQYFAQMKAKEAKEELARSNRFLDSVAKLDGVQRDSSLLYRIIEPGTGAQPNDTSFVKVNYVAKFIDGKVFDSNEGSDPVVISLKHVIKGWTMGVPKLKEGGKAVLYIPASLGYGVQGMQAIPGNAALVFDVELVHVLTPQEVKEQMKGRAQL